MRHVLPFLVLVFALVTGACAGRQVRSTHAYVAPPRAELAAADAADADDATDGAPALADSGTCPADPAKGETIATEKTENAPAVEAAPAVITSPARPAVAKRPRARTPAVSVAESGREAAGLTLPAVSTADAPPPADPAVVAASVLTVPSIAIPEPAMSRTAAPSSPDGEMPSDAPAVAPTVSPPETTPFATFGAILAACWPLPILALAVGLIGGYLLSRRRPRWVAFDEAMEASRPQMSSERDDEDDDDDIIVDDDKQPEPAPSMRAAMPKVPKIPASLPPGIFTRREPRVGPVPLPGLPPIRTPVPAPPPAPAGSDRLKTSEIAEAMSGNTSDRGTDVPKEPETLPKVIIYEPSVSTHLN